MKKSEYIYLHALCAELRRQLRESGEVPADAFDAYEAHGIYPQALHRRKTDHHEALEHLLDGLLTTIAAQRPTAPPDQSEADLVTTD